MISTNYTSNVSAAALESAVAVLAALLIDPAAKAAIFDVALNASAVPVAKYRYLAETLGPLLRAAMSAQYACEKQVASRLNVSVKTLQNARWRGTGPPYCHPFGARAVRYNTLTLELWLAENTAASTSAADHLKNGRK
ncbi:MAG: hypothetical protein VW395_09565 [Methylotenera sp.]